MGVILLPVGALILLAPVIGLLELINPILRRLDEIINGTETEEE